MSDGTCLRSNIVDTIQADIFLQYVNDKIQSQISVLESRLLTAKGFERNSIYRKIYSLNKKIEKNISVNKVL